MQNSHLCTECIEKYKFSLKVSMKKILLIIPLLLSGCTFFNVNAIDDKTYEISGHASALKSRVAMEKNIADKASKVCGSSDFDFINSKHAKINPNYTNNIANTSQTVKMTVRCDKTYSTKYKQITENSSEYKQAQFNKEHLEDSVADMIPENLINYGSGRYLAESQMTSLYKNKRISTGASRSIYENLPDGLVLIEKQSLKGGGVNGVSYFLTLQGGIYLRSQHLVKSPVKIGEITNNEIKDIDVDFSNPEKKKQHYSRIGKMTYNTDCTFIEKRKDYVSNATISTDALIYNCKTTSQDKYYSETVLAYLIGPGFLWTESTKISIGYATNHKLISLKKLD